MFACIAITFAAQARAWHTTVGGHGVDADGTFSVREVIEQDRSSTHELTQESLRLRLAAELTDWLRLDTVTRGTNGGPTIKATRSGIYNWNDVFQENTTGVDFEEAYVDADFGRIAMRVGKQRIAWGRLDRFSPNDLLNTSSYLDPLVEDESERRIGSPAVQASYFPDLGWLPAESRLTAVWLPIFIPYRFGTARCDVLGNGVSCDIERWFPPAAVAPTTFAVPAGIIALPGGGSNPAVALPIGFQARNVHPPARNLENGSVGFRYSALVQGADVAAYYFHGYDPTPAFRLSAEASGQPDPDPSNPLHVRDLKGATTLVPAFKRVNSWGADAALALDRFTLRGEGAYVDGRPFARDLRSLITDPTQLAPQLREALLALAGGSGQADVPLPDSVVPRGAIEWGVGIDYTANGYWALLQVNQTDVLNNGTDLLIKDIETRLLLNFRKTFWEERVRFQLLALHALESDYTAMRPRVTYRLTDNVAVEVGYLFVAGRSESVLGQYGDNDEGWVRVELKL